MKTDSLIVPETLVKPRSFAGLMSVYESNYLRLNTLIPHLDVVFGSSCSTAADDDLPLHLEVEERTRYTLTLRLTYLFAPDSEAGETIADPDLRLRVYFDGHLAEVMSMSASHRHHFLRDIAASHRENLDSRWRRNMLLNKWLEYLIDAGHRISS